MLMCIRDLFFARFQLIRLSRNATITLSERPGTGFEPAANVIDRHTVAKWAFLRSSR